MGNLLRLDLRRTFKSKLIFILMIASALVLILEMVSTIKDGERLAFNLMLVIFNNAGSFLTLIGGIFAGVQITGEFESRRITASVMAGNSRFSVLVSRMISYSAGIAAIYGLPSIACSAAAFIAFKPGETDGSFMSAVVLRALALTFTQIAVMSIIFAVSMFIKNLGAAIALNLGVLLALEFLMEIVVSKSWFEKLIPWFSITQKGYLLADCSSANLLKSVVAGAALIAFTLTISYMKLRKEELK